MLALKIFKGTPDPDCDFIIIIIIKCMCDVRYQGLVKL